MDVTIQPTEREVGVPADFRTISTVFSRGVSDENVVNDHFAEEHRQLLNSSATLEQYLLNSPSLAFREYKGIVEVLGRDRLRILDIGVGRGESSLYLSSQGYDVYALEPSDGFCALIGEASRKFSAPLTILRGVAEDIDKTGESDFDVVFFNSSLHHCDVPMTALRHCYSSLKPGGKIFLSAELHIRPWVSKKRWAITLQENPSSLGHYGGNEHAYYNWEYLSMLRRAGFKRVHAFPLRSSADPLFRLKRVLSGEGPTYSEVQVAARAVYYVMTARFVRHRSLFRSLATLSLVPSQFCGTKPDSTK